MINCLLFDNNVQETYIFLRFPFIFPQFNTVEMLFKSWWLSFFRVCGLVAAQDPSRPYPIPDAHLAASTTSILDHSSYLEGYADQQWYLDNIPFVDLPDNLLQDLYYYRQSVVKRHLKFERQGIGKALQ